MRPKLLRHGVYYASASIRYPSYFSASQTTTGEITRFFDFKTFTKYHGTKENDQKGELDHVISNLVLDASKSFRQRLETDSNKQWGAANIQKLLRDFYNTQSTNVLVPKDIVKALENMNAGGSCFALVIEQPVAY